MRKLIVKSSNPLTKAQIKRLEQGIRSKETEEIVFTYIVENVVGGLAIIDGEKIYDATFATELHKAKKNAAKLMSSLRSSSTIFDIPKILKERLEEIVDLTHNFEKCGTVISAADGIVKINGLSGCKYGELIIIGEKGCALAMNLEEEFIGAILLTDNDSVEYGDIAYSTDRIIEVPVGEELLSRVIDPMGRAIDGHSEIKFKNTRRIECDSPRIIDRDKVNEPLSTGILAIDAMIPIGKGQRELIIGDRQTGKTAIAIDTIINQKNKDVICVYVAIGQRASAISKLIKVLEDNGAMPYTVIVMSTASDPAPLQYIAPYTGASIAEQFMYEGKDVLVIYDDLTKHSVAYRAISLLLKRPAGREAYPGDIFYVHSKLLERSAKLSKDLGGGSITALPIIETQAGDISAYIPTNVISITDGQIYLEGELFNAGQRPAINVGLSVSRVGGSAQTKLMRNLSSKLRLELAHYRELAIFAQFGSSLDNSTKEILNYGAKIEEAIKQPEYMPLNSLREHLYLFVIVNKLLTRIEKKRVKEFLNGFYNYVLSSAGNAANEIKNNGTLSQENEIKLRKTAEEYISVFLNE